MLPAINQFNWSASSFAATPGTLVTLIAGGPAHTKGVDTAVMNGLAEDCYGISLFFGAGNTNGTIRRQMVDLLIDPAAGAGNAGSSWTTLINNLYVNSPTHGNGAMGYCYYFPLFVPAGTAFGARTQDTVSSATVGVSIRVYGKPTRPELIKCGSKVQTIGADTASTSGVAITPGVTFAMGSYTASLGTLTSPAWWWQLGIGTNDSTMNVLYSSFDIAEDATAKYLCAQGILYSVISNAENAWKTAFGDIPPVHYAASGQDVYVRGGCDAAAFDGTPTVVVYALGG